MGLRTIPRGIDQQNTLIRRFQTASSNAVPDDIEKRKELQEEVRQAVLGLATLIDVEIADGRDKSIALTSLEDVLLRAGRAIFS